jgi:hypothetical protein
VLHGVFLPATCWPHKPEARRRGACRRGSESTHGRRQKEGKRFFFEEKKQKTFDC